MAYVVERKGGQWELRVAEATPRGPRSRTLATFRELTEDVMAKAVERSEGRITPDQVSAAARRVGAPVADDPALAAARDLTAALARGTRLPNAWQRILRASLDEAPGAPTDAERAAAAWAASSLDERGRALHDLLLLADRLPSRRRAASSRFPRLVSSA